MVSASISAVSTPPVQIWACSKEFVSFTGILNSRIVALIAGIFSIAGNYLGTRCFDKGGAKFVKPLMMVVLVIFFIKTLSEILGA